MSSVLNTAIAGLNNAATRVANAASSIVNASSTPLPSQNSSNNNIGFAGQDAVTVDLSSSILTQKLAQVDYAANAAVIKTDEKNQKALLDILS